MTPSSLVLALALATSALPAVDIVSTPVDTGRPVVLLVHGRGYLTRDSAEFRKQAVKALRQGAFRATGDSLFSHDDVRIVWYAELLDPRRRDARSASPSCERADRGDSPMSIIQTLALVASDLLDASGSEKEVTDVRDLAADLRFFGDPGTRCAAEGRVADALVRARDEGRPVVLIAHSLGAFVTWGHLQRRGADTTRAHPEVRRLVTVGSPIGSSQLRELLFGDSRALALPRGVRSWVNAVNDDDPFATRLVMTDSATGRARALTGIVDVATGRSGEDVHDLRSYLSDASAAMAVVSAWCEAADAKGRPSGCRAALK